VICQTDLRVHVLLDLLLCASSEKRFGSRANGTLQSPAGVSTYSTLCMSFTVDAQVFTGAGHHSSGDSECC
jgi:hypothetical protein